MKRIFLVRHGESEFNVDPSIGKTKPDHAINLTAKGEWQAAVAGKFLNSWLFENISSQNRDGIRVWTSPYYRARSTARHVEAQCSDWVRDSREHVLLCEQQFGLFDGIHHKKWGKKFPKENDHYQKCVEHEGRFWANIPMGESRFDVATRIHQTFSTFHRDADCKGIDNIIIICHGVTMRAFLMMWLQLTPEWFDSEPNPSNCAIRLIEKGEDRGYIFDGFST